MFKGRNLVIATKHEKEIVIAPILEKHLGVTCFVAPDFDTDELGTFTGEIERKDDPITTVRNKCLLAMQLTGCDMAIASEGSFGSHPSFFFIPADDEILLFIDKKNNLEIIIRELSTDTNFQSEIIKSEKELKDFANSVQFPSHGIIGRNSKENFTEIVKDIKDWNKLLEVYNYYINLYGSIYLETDMRAMFNPTRMKVIEKATQKLVDKINSFCPSCNTPGFGITNREQGLPCELCMCPTSSTMTYIYCCQKCSFTKKEMYPNNKTTEDAMYCDFCNP